MSKLKVAIVGYGQIGPVHAQAYSNIEDVEIACIVDLDEEKAKKAQQDYNIPRRLTSYDEMLKMDDIDIVSVCIPTYLHADLTIKAAKAGKHVFCEKPMAMKLEDADAMIEACDKAGVKLGLGFCRRFDGEWLKLRELVYQKAVGKPMVWRHMTAGEGAPTPWFFDKDLGGGPFMDGAVHNYDFGRYMFGEVKEVKADLHRLRSNTTAFDTGTVILYFESGDKSVLHWSWGLPRGSHGCYMHDIIGPEGAILFENPAKDPLVTDDEKHGILYISKANREVIAVQYEKTHMYEEELRHFVNCIIEDKKPAVGGKEGFEALKIALAVLKAGETGEVVKIS